MAFIAVASPTGSIGLLLRSVAVISGRLNVDVRHCQYGVGIFLVGSSGVMEVHSFDNDNTEPKKLLVVVSGCSYRWTIIESEFDRIVVVVDVALATPVIGWWNCIVAEVHFVRSSESWYGRYVALRDVGVGGLFLLLLAAGGIESAHFAHGRIGSSFVVEFGGSRMTLWASCFGSVDGSLDRC